MANSGRDRVVPLLILNLTPNSFSDGGKFLDFKNLEAQIHLAKSLGINHFDLGAESTAPFNDPISHRTEVTRIEQAFFKNWERLELTNVTLSLDSYRLETVQWFLGQLRDRGFQGEFIWNDVSGKLDSSVIQFLKSNKNHRYIFCHSLASTREESSSHMNFVQDLEEENFIEEYLQYFLSAHELAGKEDILDQIIFDPCFGFSKSFEQNWFLLRDEGVCYPAFLDRVLFGLSRKSVLKKKLIPEASLIALEALHYDLFLSHQENFGGERFYWRLHDPWLYHSFSQRGEGS